MLIYFYIILFKENSSKPLGMTEGPLECSFEECGSRELVPVICEHCHKNYCLRYFAT